MLMDGLQADRAPMASGGVESEGVEVIGAYSWHQAGISGEGVKVGLIDSGFGASGSCWDRAS